MRIKTYMSLYINSSLRCPCRDSSVRVSKTLRHRDFIKATPTLERNADLLTAWVWACNTLSLLLSAQVVHGRNARYLDDASQHVRLTTAMYKELAAVFHRDPARNAHVAEFEALLDRCGDVFVKHGIAKNIGLQTYATELEQEHSCLTEL